jgi:hypothetical protein
MICSTDALLTRPKHLSYRIETTYRYDRPNAEQSSSSKSHAQTKGSHKEANQPKSPIPLGLVSLSNAISANISLQAYRLLAVYTDMSISDRARYSQVEV